MILPSTLGLSLYHLVQAAPTTPPAITITALSLETMVGALVDLVLAENVPAQLWCKQPEGYPWLKQMELYQQQAGRGSKVYLCELQKNLTTSGSGLVSLQLQGGGHLKQEFFLVVASSQFTGLVIARKPELKATYLRGTKFEVVCSFAPEVVAQVLTEIRQAIAISDQTPDDLLFNGQGTISLPQQANSHLLTNLLLKQVKRSEEMQHDSQTVAQAERNEAALSKSLRFKDELLSQVVTELCTPLTNMKTALSLLENKQIKAAQRERYRLMLRGECDRQSALISGLIELVELENIPQQANDSPVPLEDLVPGIVSTYQPLASEKGISLGYTIPAGLPFVSCPTIWLRQIIVNLLDNGLKFTPIGGQVYVQGTVVREQVKLTFTDTGTGIPPGDVQKIFNSFYRGRRSTIEDTAGAGLGLTVVQQLLSHCGGSIEVESKLGEGAKFEVFLPVLKK